MTEAWLVLGCVLTCAAVGASALPSAGMGDPNGAAAGAQRRFERRLAVHLVLIASICMLSVIAIGAGSPLFAAPLALGGLLILALMHPWPWLRAIVIPLGWSRLAMAMARLGSAPWERDPAGGRILVGAMAKLRQRRHSPGSTARLRRELGGMPLRGAGLVAAGLLAAEEGDDDSARRLLDSLDLLDPDAVPPLARQVAIDWLVADDATLGRWEALVERTEEVPQLSSTTTFLSLCARRMLGQRVTGRELVRAWLVAPRRRKTLQLLRRALAVGSSVGMIEAADDLPRAAAANDAGDPVRTLVSMHIDTARAAETGRVSPAVLRRLSALWTHTMTDATVVDRLRKQIVDEPGGSVGNTINALLRQAVEDVRAMLPRMSAPIDSPVSGVLRRALQAHVDEQVEVVVRCIEEVDMLADRHSFATSLMIYDGCLRLRESYDELLRITGSVASKSLFGQVERTIGRAAALLWTQRDERALGHSLSMWLVLEAERVHDGIAAEHHRRHVAIGL